MCKVSRKVIDVSDSVDVRIINWKKRILASVSENLIIIGLLPLYFISVN